MMRYINIHQEQAIEYNLNIKEVIVLDYILKANSWARRITIDGVDYFEVRAGKISDDLPILEYSKRQIQNITSKLVELGLLDKKINNNIPYYSTTQKTMDYVFSGVKSSSYKCEKNNTPSMKHSSHYSNINNSNINIEKKNKKEIAENIYNIYFSMLPKDKLKYIKKATAIKWISQLLNSYEEKSLLKSIERYKKVTDEKYYMAPQYFFSNTDKGKVYRPFEDYLDDSIHITEDERLEKLKERYKDFNF